MLNWIWLGLVLSAVLMAGFTGRIKDLVDGAVKGAETSVTLAIGLIGIMAVWLGVMRLAEKSGLVQSIARLLRPLLRWLFPDVPGDHPAMGSMVMNIAANMLGLTNAATPLGLRAMRDLESLNPIPGTATNAMCTFLAINTSSVQLIPMTAVALMASAGSKNPTAIIGTSFLATLCSSFVGIVAVKILERSRVYQSTSAPATTEVGAATPAESTSTPIAPLPVWGWPVLLGFFGCFAWFFVSMTFFAGPSAAAGELAGGNYMVKSVHSVSLLAIPFLLTIFPLYAGLRRIAVYEEFVEGAKEGFQVAVRIIPFLVTMLMAIGMFRSAGGIDILTRWLHPLLDLVHFPAELLPISLMRPLSGSASLALFSDLVKQYGPDHIIPRMAGTLFGSTETTFYVVAVYFGAVNVKRTRHAIPAGLLADATGVIASIAICRAVFS